MSIIKPSSILRNNYNEISKICNETREPVFITKNGEGDLAVMSMELYEELSGLKELYFKLDRGMNAINEGRYVSAEKLLDELLLDE